MSKNNIPLDDFHLKIFMDETDTTKVHFRYTTPENNEITNSEEAENYSGTQINSELFIFKTLLENLTKEELELLRKSRPIVSNEPPKDIWNKFREGLKLKLKHDKKKNLMKRKIKKMENLTLLEKKEKIRHYKQKCINCARKVDNIFILDNEKLQILCGDSETPCDYNFEFIKPIVINIPLTIQHLTTQINELNIKIIKLRLEILFKLSPEDIVMEEFQTLANELKKMKSEKNSLVGHLQKNQSNDERENQKNIENIKLQEYISFYKQNIKKYQAEDNSDAFKEAIEIYQNDILVLQDKIRNLSFKYVNMEKNEELFELIQKKNDYASEEYFISNI